MKNEILNGILHEVTDDIRKALMSDEQILSRWNSLTPIQRNE